MYAGVSLNIYTFFSCGHIYIFLIGTQYHTIELFLVPTSAPVNGMVHTKDPLLLIGKSRPYGGNIGFPLSLSGPLPYVQSHITVNKMCCVRR